VIVAKIDETEASGQFGEDYPTMQEKECFDVYAQQMRSIANALKPDSSKD
jgi:hypothetical protein